MEDRVARFTIDFSDVAAEQIEELAQELQLRTKADVLRKALGVLKYIVEEKRQGGRVFIENRQEGERKEIVAI